MSRCAYLVVLFVVLGVALRLLGFFDPGLQLWLDEASWAEMLADGTATWIRPAGFMALSSLLTGVRNDEVFLRLPSLVAGIAVLPLFAAVLRRRVSWPWVCVGVGLLALNPIAISLSKEFKPYALETTLHVALWFFVVRWLDRRSLVDLAAFAALAIVAPLFSWSVVFSYPGLFALVGWQAWRQRQTAALITAATSAAVAFVVLVTIFLLRVADQNEKARFWGRKYDVFYVGHSVVDGWLWALRKTAAVAGLPGRLSLAGPLRSWEPSLPIVVATLTLVAVVALVHRRRFQLLVLFGAPWAFTLFFNALGKWPYGVFRTNLYLLPCVLGLLVTGLAEAASYASSSSSSSSSSPWPRRAVALAAAAGALLVWPWDLSRFAIKEESSLALSSSVRTALEQIVAATPEHPASPVDVILDGHACGIYRYYARLHAETKRTLGPALARADRFRVTCGGFTEAKWGAALQGIGTTPTWVVVAKPPFIALTHAMLTATCDALTTTELPAATAVFRCAPRHVSLTTRNTASPPVPAAVTAAVPAAEPAENESE